MNGQRRNEAIGLAKAMDRDQIVETLAGVCDHADDLTAVIVELIVLVERVNDERIVLLKMMASELGKSSAGGVSLCWPEGLAKYPNGRSGSLRSE